MPAARARSRADEGRVKPRSDAYVGLLGLSLLALTAAMLFAFLNWQGISEKPKPVQMAAPAGGGGAAPRIAPGGPANAPAPAPGAGGAQAPPGPAPAAPGGNQPAPKK